MQFRVEAPQPPTLGEKAVQAGKSVFNGFVLLILALPVLVILAVINKTLFLLFFLACVVGLGYFSLDFLRSIFSMFSTPRSLSQLFAC